MRTISTLVIIFLSVTAIGQIDVSSEPCDCPFTYKENKDEILTMVVDRSLVPVRIGTASLSSIEVKASVAQLDEVFTIHLFYPGDLGCMTSQSYARFTFVDGTELDVEHTGYEDCDDILHFNGKVFDELGTFRTMAVDKIRLYGTETHDDLNIEAGTYFMDAFNCCIF